MFTGIVEATAAVEQITETQLSVARPASFDDIAIGSSIAVSGVCLSVSAFTESSMTFDVVAETWAKSALGTLQTGDTVNLERSVPANGRLDGHLVQGHVEGVGKWKVESGKWKVILPKDLIKFCVQKGSICLNGVSLTIADIHGDEIEVALVPHTLEHTNLDQLQTGDPVNIETDIIGRYVYAFSHAV